jgi:N-acyl amino acid synthase of PEP-CTERM/exosortase system
MGLYQAMYHESKRLGLSHWYMITEKKIFNSLKKFGFEFQQIGDPVEYHGLRIPFLGIIDQMEQKIIRENPILLKLILRDLEKPFHPSFGFFGTLRMVYKFPHFTRKAWNYWVGRRK